MPFQICSRDSFPPSTYANRGGRNYDTCESFFFFSSSSSTSSSSFLPFLSFSFLFVTIQTVLPKQFRNVGVWKFLKGIHEFFEDAEWIRGLALSAWQCCTLYRVAFLSKARHMSCVACRYFPKSRSRTVLRAEWKRGPLWQVKKKREKRREGGKKQKVIAWFRQPIPRLTCRLDNAMDILTNSLFFIVLSYTQPYTYPT